MLPAQVLVLRFCPLPSYCRVLAEELVLETPPARTCLIDLATPSMDRESFLGVYSCASWPSLATATPSFWSRFAVESLQRPAWAQILVHTV
ncbi:hypothetical protein DENSPDRAFT_841639 [Dentipellis sp. KUC8613]|nr:hypothetical protein DENSPDRAFT_841639 [Dentipellis sp. KUC8613]